MDKQDIYEARRLVLEAGLEGWFESIRRQANSALFQAVEEAYALGMKHGKNIAKSIQQLEEMDKGKR